MEIKKNMQTVPKKEFLVCYRADLLLKMPELKYNTQL